VCNFKRLKELRAQGICIFRPRPAGRRFGRARGADAMFPDRGAGHMIARDELGRPPARLRRPAKKENLCGSALIGRGRGARSS